MPSNTEQILGQFAGAQGFLQQAGANQRAKMDFALGQQQNALAQQQLGLEREKMMQQGQQFERGLQAEAQNYALLNKSRAEMQQRELAQSSEQFGQRMSFDLEQVRVERLMTVKMKQIETDMMRNEQEIAAMADNDPRMLEAQAKRRSLRANLRNMEMMMGSTQAAQGLAMGLKEDRMAEVDARIDAFQGATKARADAALGAMQQGLDYAVLKDAQEGGFIKEVSRLAVGDVPGQLFKEGLLKPAYGTAALNILADQVRQWAGISGDPAMAEAKATEFQKSAPGMAASIVHNAISLGKDAFGMEPGKVGEASELAVRIIGDAAILAGVDPSVRAGKGEGAEMLRNRIADNLNRLRKTGMGDEQISAIFDGLQAASENRPALLLQYQERDANVVQGGMLDRTLAGLGSIVNMVEGVAGDNARMQANGGGGRITDFSKYDWSGVTRKARMAYGMGQSQELSALLSELRARGMESQDIDAMTRLLVEQDPRLQFLRPEEFASALKGMAYGKMEGGGQLEGLEEDIGRLQGQLVAGGRAAGLSETEKRLEELAALMGG
jgi:hypothetical protein